MPSKLAHVVGGRFDREGVDGEWAGVIAEFRGSQELPREMASACHRANDDFGSHFYAKISI